MAKDKGEKMGLAAAVDAVGFEASVIDVEVVDDDKSENDANSNT